MDHLRRCSGSQKHAYRLPESRCDEQCGAYGRRHSPRHGHICLASVRSTLLKVAACLCFEQKRLKAPHAPPVLLAWLYRFWGFGIWDSCGVCGRIADLRRPTRSPRIARTSSQTEPKTKKKSTCDASHLSCCTDQQHGSVVVAVVHSLPPPVSQKQSVYCSSNSSSVPPTAGASKSRPNW